MDNKGELRKNLSPSFWLLLSFLSILILVITILKDLWLTGMEPNIIFYFVVPPLSTFGGTVCAYGLGRLVKQAIHFAEILAVVWVVNLIMQVGENVLKLIYYRVWEYPGILYLLFVLPLGILLVAFGFSRWVGIKWWWALLMTVAELVGEIVIAAFLTGLGIHTPGS